MYNCIYMYVVKPLIPFLLQSQREDKRELPSEVLSSVAGFFPPVSIFSLFHQHVPSHYINKCVPFLSSVKYMTSLSVRTFLCVVLGNIAPSCFIKYPMTRLSVAA